MNSSGESFVFKQIQAIKIAFGFMSLLPVGRDTEFSKTAIHNSLFWYPAVGFAIGLILFALAFLLPFSPLLNAALIVAAWLVLTGALHMDGLADCADAWIGGIGDRGRTLAIMKDPHSGSLATVTVCSHLILKVAAVEYLLSNSLFTLLVIVPVLSRISAAELFLSCKYIGEGFMGTALADVSLKQGITTAVVWAAISYIAFPEIAFLLFLVLVASAHLFIRALCVRRLQGFTGDCAGTLIELSELMLLLGGVLIMS